MSWGETLVRFVLAVFATWRVTHLLALEDGPGDVVFHLRRWVGDSPLGGLMDCFNCLSFWVAAPAALFVAARPLAQPLYWAVGWLALSGAACWLERLGAPAEPGPPPPPEGDIHVLR
jgi:hypothetical protein